MSGGDDDDVIQGWAGADEIDGGDGDDTLGAGNGNDLVRGGAGDDRIGGNRGDDTLIGGEGADRMIGGVGDDTLYLEGADWADGGPGNDRYVIIGQGEGLPAIGFFNANEDALVVALENIHGVTEDMFELRESAPGEAGGTYLLLVEDGVETPLVFLNGVGVVSIGDLELILQAA